MLPDFLKGFRGEGLRVDLAGRACSMLGRELS